MARIWVIRFPYGSHSPRWGKRVSRGGRRAFFLCGPIITNEELRPMSRELAGMI